MSAYYSSSLQEFVRTPCDRIVSLLHARYASDGFSSQYTTQSESWIESIQLLQSEIESLLEKALEAKGWKILLEFPLYRLRRRIDVVVLTVSSVVVIELKVGESHFKVADKRQAEEYALDLRDFHGPSADATLIPVLWCTAAPQVYPSNLASRHGVCEVVEIGNTGLAVC